MKKLYNPLYLILFGASFFLFSCDSSDEATPDCSDCANDPSVIAYSDRINSGTGCQPCANCAQLALDLCLSACDDRQDAIEINRNILLGYQQINGGIPCPELVPGTTLLEESDDDDDEENRPAIGTVVFSFENNCWHGTVELTTWDASIGFERTKIFAVGNSFSGPHGTFSQKCSGTDWDLENYTRVKYHFYTGTFGNQQNVRDGTIRFDFDDEEKNITIQ